MLRWLTAGESHGPSLTGIIEGLPAGIRVVTDDIAAALARRRLGYGRGARMKFEQDKVSILSGVRHGFTQGGPVTILIENTEWPKWEEIMAADPVDPQSLTGGRAQALTRPRPGHADLTGMRKYGFDDARPVLERASARETATRVALGVLAEAMLRQVAGIEMVAHVVGIGEVSRPADAPLPVPGDTAALDDSPVRNLDADSAKAMVEAIDICHREGDTIGGQVEVLAYGVPAGLGSYVHWDRKLDARIAAALMGIQAIKAVEVGDGLRTSMRRGSQAHDEIIRDAQDKIQRITNRAGGIEGGMSNGEIIRVRAGMKPISTVPRALQTVDTSTGESAKAIHQRSDVCAVPPAAVVAQAMVALVLADALLEKTGGDSVAQMQANLKNYLDSVAEFQQ